MRHWKVGVSLVGAAMVLSIASAASLPKAPQLLHASSILQGRALLLTGASQISHPCPREMALIGASCVDRYEGSLVEVAEDGSETPWSPYAPPNGHTVRAVSRPHVVPQAHISMLEAKRACAASHKRLCKEDEWKAACKGPSTTRYPYGEARVPNACVDTNRRSPMTTLYGGHLTGRSLNDPRSNQLAKTVERTGAAAQCTNDYGVHDMVGNVHEWIDDGTFRGGFYLDTKQNGEGCDYRTTAHNPSYYDYSTGFRCCADANSGLADDGE
jgi:formylglycine-generating enzyme